jgi:hypothetical protein
VVFSAALTTLNSRFLDFCPEGHKLVTRTSQNWSGTATTMGQNGSWHSGM